MTLAGPIAKLQRSFAYRLSRTFPSEMLRWMDRISDAADQIPTNAGTVISVDSVVGSAGSSSLQAITPTVANQTADVKGYYAPGDYGGGTFFWDPASTDLDNGGTVISTLDSLVGRWIRIWEYGELDVRWFGAQPNIDNLIQAGANDFAIASSIALLGASHGGTLKFPCQNAFEGIYYVSAEVLLSNLDGITLEGAGAWVQTSPAAKFGSWLKVATGAAALPFVLRFLHAHNCFNQSLNIDCHALADIGMGINSVAASNKTSQHCGVYNCRIEGAVGAHGYGMSIGELDSGASQSSQQVSNVEVLDCIIETCPTAISIEGGQTTSVTIAGARGILSGSVYSIDTYAPDLVIREINFETSGTADVLVRSGAGIVRMFDGKSETFAGISVKFESGARVKDTLISGWTFLYNGTPDASNLIIDYKQGGNLVCIGCAFQYGNAPHADTVLNNYAGVAPGTPFSVTEIGCSYGNGAKPSVTSANGSYYAINPEFGSATVTPIGRMYINNGAGQAIGDTLPTVVNIPSAGTYSYMKTGALAALGVTNTSIQKFGDVANGGSVWQGAVSHDFTLSGITKFKYTDTGDLFEITENGVGLAIGLTPASTGTIRLGRVAVNGLYLVTLKDQSATVDLHVLTADTGDNLYLGWTSGWAGVYMHGTTLHLLPSGAAGVDKFTADNTGISFFNHAIGAQQTVTGALVDLTASGALKSLLTALANYGLIIDGSS